jgi:hypothetical protein
MKKSYAMTEYLTPNQQVPPCPVNSIICNSIINAPGADSATISNVTQNLNCQLDTSSQTSANTTNVNTTKTPEKFTTALDSILPMESLTELYVAIPICIILFVILGFLVKGIYTSFAVSSILTSASIPATTAAETTAAETTATETTAAETTAAETIQPSSTRALYERILQEDD